MYKFRGKTSCTLFYCWKCRIPWANKTVVVFVNGSITQLADFSMSKGNNIYTYLNFLNQFGVVEKNNLAAMCFTL